MNIQAILIPLLTNLVSKILSNQFTKQHIDNDIKDISITVGEHVRASQVEKDATILMLEGKLNDLVAKLDVIIDAKIDEIVKNVQDKTPFFLDGIVEKFGEEAKHQIDVFSKNGTQDLIDFLEGKASELGLLKTKAVEPVQHVNTEVSSETEVEHVEVAEKPTKDGLDFLSDKANEILHELKDKHKE